MLTDPSEYSLEQVARLSCLPGYPFPIDGQIELARALEAVVGDNRAYAERVISSFCEDGGRCPDTRDIRLRAFDITHPDGQSRGNCEQCGGSGWISFTKLRKGVAYDYARPCKCHAPIEVSE